MRKSVPTIPLHPWACILHPWQRVHIDYAQKDGVNFLAIIDSHSKWMEVFTMNSTTTEKTIEKIYLFAAYGFSEQLVSDNGPQFAATLFHNFCQKNISSIM